MSFYKKNRESSGVLVQLKKYRSELRSGGKLHFHYIDKQYGGYCKNGEGDSGKAISILELAAKEGYSKAYAGLGEIYKDGNSFVVCNRILFVGY